MPPRWSWDPATVLQDFNSQRLSNGPGATMSAPHSNAYPTSVDNQENVPPPHFGAKGGGDVFNPTPVKVHQPVASAPSTDTKPATGSRKRKSGAVVESEALPEIDDDDPRLQVVDQSCQQVRTKVRLFINMGTMKVGEFQAAIDVGSVQYYRFMNLRGKDAGFGSEVYYKAWKFFKKRELQGIKGTGAKKAKTASTKAVASKAASKTTDALDVSDITLEGEDQGKVPIFENCDEVRKKIYAFLKKGDITQAAFLREIAKSFPEERTVQSKQLNDFLSKKGALDGNTSCVFYGSYVFFEKLRIKNNKPKSAQHLSRENLNISVGTSPKSLWTFSR